MKDVLPRLTFEISLRKSLQHAKESKSDLHQDMVVRLIRVEQPAARNAVICTSVRHIEHFDVSQTNGVHAELRVTTMGAQIEDLGANLGKGDQSSSKVASPVWGP